MTLHGNSFIGFGQSKEGKGSFRATNPTTGEEMDPPFHHAATSEVDRATAMAAAAFEEYEALPATRRAVFLRAIGEQIMALGDELLERTAAETALPMARLQGERGRTVGQLTMFADLVEEGSWVDARIDRAQPDRQPIPKPDLRRMLIPIGPVAVFGASNFPLAFSVAGGDTASALAAGCPVIVKAHRAHPGTSELVAQAVVTAAQKTEMPEGVFSLVHGTGQEVGQRLVRDPRIKAVGFTGSLAGGRALFDAAGSRVEPIPVYAEMGSLNPVFILPDALAQRGEALAEGLVGSVTQGVGQFCTNPGMAIVLDSKQGNAFIARTGSLLEKAPVGTMVSPGIKKSYDQAMGEVGALKGVELEQKAGGEGAHSSTSAPAAIFVTTADAWFDNPRLSEEIYGPATVALRCDNTDDMLRIARSLTGHLTATLHATDKDLAAHPDLVRVLRQKVGRLVVNGFPTGVEVCPSMHHGGPYPATTVPWATSVGTAAIYRFVKPICLQGFPQAALPEELQDDNPRRISRIVDGELTR